MGPDPAAHPPEQVRHPQGRPAASECARGRQRVAVLDPHELPVADAAPRLRPLADGPPLLPDLATRWHVAEDSRRPPPEGSRPGRSQTYPLRGDPRQPVGEDRGKRGARGYDAGKKVKGRKRHILVDTVGHLWKIVVHSADIQDRDGAKLLLMALPLMLHLRIQIIWADGGYRGTLIEWCWQLMKATLTIVSPPPEQQGFSVLPRRWVVERTFAWLGNYRRLSKDYEECTRSSEGMIYLASIHTTLKRLTA
jgi:transposase